MEEKKRPNYEKLKARVQELAAGPSDRAGVEVLLRKISISQKTVNREDIAARKQEILDRVQKKAEAYYQVSRSCAKSPALAVMEEFGFGGHQDRNCRDSFSGGCTHRRDVRCRFGSYCCPLRLLWERRYI